MKGIHVLAISALGILLSFSFPNVEGGSDGPTLMAETFDALAELARSYQHSEGKERPERVNTALSMLAKAFAKQFAFNGEAGDAASTFVDEVMDIYKKQEVLRADMKSITAAIDARPAPAREKELRNEMRSLISEYEENLKNMFISILRSDGHKTEEAKATLEVPVVSALLKYLQASSVEQFKLYM